MYIILEIFSPHYPANYSSPVSFIGWQMFCHIPLCLIQIQKVPASVFIRPTPQHSPMALPPSTPFPAGQCDMSSDKKFKGLNRPPNSPDPKSIVHTGAIPIHGGPTGPKDPPTPWFSTRQVHAPQFMCPCLDS